MKLPNYRTEPPTPEEEKALFASIHRSTQLMRSWKTGSDKEIERLKTLIRCGEAYLRAVGKPDDFVSQNIKEAIQKLNAKGYDICEI